MGPPFSLYLLPDEVLQFLKRCHLTCEQTIRDLFASFNFRIVNPLFWKYGQCRSKSKTFNFWKLDWNFEIWTPRAPFSVNHIFVTYWISVGGNIHGPFCLLSICLLSFHLLSGFLFLCHFAYSVKNGYFSKVHKKDI